MPEPITLLAVLGMAWSALGRANNASGGVLTELAGAGLEKLGLMDWVTHLRERFFDPRKNQDVIKALHSAWDHSVNDLAKIYEKSERQGQNVQFVLHKSCLLSQETKTALFPPYDTAAASMSQIDADALSLADTDTLNGHLIAQLVQLCRLGEMPEIWQNLVIEKLLAGLRVHFLEELVRDARSRDKFFAQQIIEIRKENQLAALSDAELQKSLNTIAANIENLLTSKLDSIATTLDEIKAAVTAGQAQTPRSPIRVRTPFLCVGRDEEKRELLELVLAENTAPILVYGTAGMGKTTLTETVLNQTDVVRRYEERRYFVDCQNAETAETLTARAVEALGEELSPNNDNTLRAALSREPAILFLDNFETPWERETSRVQNWLRTYADYRNILFVVTMRGSETPKGVLWRPLDEMKVLDRLASHGIFRKHSRKDFSTDPHLDKLLNAVGDHPLAVTLLAYQAENARDLSELWKRWQEESTQLLQSEDEEDKDYSLRVSFNLSIGHADKPELAPRMNDNARLLLSILAMLPADVASDHIEHIALPEIAKEKDRLVNVGLAQRRDNRLTLLPILREFVNREYPVPSDDMGMAMKHYLTLAIEQGNKLGTGDGKVAIGVMTPELANIEIMLYLSATTAEIRHMIDAVFAFSELMRVTGMRETHIIEEIAEIAEQDGDFQSEADCIQMLGSIALAHSDYDESIRLYTSSLQKSEAIGHAIGQANSLMQLGQVALFRADYQKALELFEKALPIYEEIIDPLGQANCIAQIGQIMMHRQDYNAAEEHLRKAMTLFWLIDAVQGQASCLHALGDIALALRKFDIARGCYEEALGMSKKGGVRHGEATCLLGLYEVEFESSNFGRARELLEEALSIYKVTGSVLGRANCIESFGELEAQQGNREKAKEYFLEAYDLFKGLSVPYSMGISCYYLSRVAETNEEKQRYREEARRLWLSIDRPDMVEKHLNTPMSRAQNGISLRRKKKR